MTRRRDATNGAATTGKKRSPAPRKEKGDAQKANDGLTEKQVLALWELIVTGDGKTKSQRHVELDPPDVKSLVSAGLITVENGPRPKQPTWMSKIHLTDKAWHWATDEGTQVHMPSLKATASVLDALLGKIGNYLKTRKVGLHQLITPRPAVPEPAEAADEHADGEVQGPRATLEDRIRAAYLRVTGGVMNQHVKLARLRAALGDESVEAVNEELCRMQQGGTTVLYPIDDPQRLRPEDEGAALRVAGERRDLVCIRG